jgi:predicted MFS family arabinose efflux permease
MNQQKDNVTGILGFLFLIGLLGELDYQLIPPLLPLLAKDFQVDPGYGGRAVTVYSLSSAFFSLLFGYLSDRLGRKPFILLGLLGFSSVSFLTRYAGSMEMFFLLRCLSGMATGALVPSMTSFAADSFRYEQRGRAMGILSMPYFVAAIVGIPLAAVVASTWGWRPIFLTLSAAALGCAALVYRILTDPSTQVEAVAIPQRLELERIQMVWKRILKNRETSSILLASMLSSSAIVGFITYLGSHLVADRHLSVKQVGFVYLFCGVASLLGAPLSGILSDKWAKQPILILSGVVLALCFLVIPALPWNFWLFGALGLAGLAIAFRIAPFLAITTELVLPEERGTVLALRVALSQLGIGLTTYLASHAFLYKGFRLVGLLVAVELLLSSAFVFFFVVEPET